MLLTLTILGSIIPDPSVEPPVDELPPAKPQLPDVTQIQTPTVLLLTIKLV